MKTDYKPEIKKNILEWYIPLEAIQDKTEATIFKSLSSIHEDVIDVLPAKWIDETDVYEVLIELNFKTFKVENDDNKIQYLYGLQPNQ